jgi:hypothetical protein
MENNSKFVINESNNNNDFQLLENNSEFVNLEKKNKNNIDFNSMNNNRDFINFDKDKKNININLQSLENNSKFVNIDGKDYEKNEEFQSNISYNNPNEIHNFNFHKNLITSNEFNNKKDKNNFNYNHIDSSKTENNFEPLESRHINQILTKNEERLKYLSKIDGKLNNETY